MVKKEQRRSQLLSKQLRKRPRLRRTLKTSLRTSQRTSLRTRLKPNQRLKLPKLSHQSIICHQNLLWALHLFREPSKLPQALMIPQMMKLLALFREVHQLPLNRRLSQQQFQLSLQFSQKLAQPLSILEVNQFPLKAWRTRMMSFTPRTSLIQCSMQRQTLARR